jgi:hypothetical protein
MPGGSAIWEKWGHTHDMTFDLAPDSVSRRAFDAYLENKGLGATKAGKADKAETHAETFAESDWQRQPTQRTQNKWVNAKTGQVTYSKTNPGGARRTQKPVVGDGKAAAGGKQATATTPAAAAAKAAGGKAAGQKMPFKPHRSPAWTNSFAANGLPKRRRRRSSICRT